MAVPRKPASQPARVAPRAVEKPAAPAPFVATTPAPVEMEAPVLAAPEAPVEAAPAVEQVAAPETTPAPAAFVLESADAVLASVRDAHEQFRVATEQALEKSRSAYARLKTEAETATGSLESSFAATREGLQTLNGKTLAAIRSQTEAGFEHFRALLAARDPKDFFTLQSEFARKQFELATTQTREIADDLQKVALHCVEPLKSAIAARAAT